MCELERARSSRWRRRIDDVRLACQSRRIFVHAPQLGVVADDVLFQTVLFRVQCGNRAHRLRNRDVQGRYLFGQAHQVRAVAGHALAQLLDLALGGKNAARLDLRAARDEVRTAEDVAIDRGNGRGVSRDIAIA